MAKIVLGIGTSHTPLLSLPPEMWPTTPRTTSATPSSRFRPTATSCPSAAGSRDAARPRASPATPGRSPSPTRRRASRRPWTRWPTTLQDAEPGHHRHHQRRPGRVVLRAQHAALRGVLGRKRAAHPARRRRRTRPRWPAASPTATATCRSTCPWPAASAATWSSTCATTTSIRAHVNACAAAVRRPGRPPLSDPRRRAELASATPRRASRACRTASRSSSSGCSTTSRGRSCPCSRTPAIRPTSRRPKRSYQLGQAIGDAVQRVGRAGARGGGRLGRIEPLRGRRGAGPQAAQALENKDAATLQSLPKERLYSATSESLNWVAVGGAMEKEPLKFDLVDYVPVYRTPANTGGGWAFGRWQ